MKAWHVAIATATAVCAAAVGAGAPVASAAPLPAGAQYEVVASQVVGTATGLGVPTVGPVKTVRLVNSQCDQTRLRYGSTGLCVWVLQNVLNNLFHAGLVVDSVYGPATTTAVRQLQQRYGLVVDGITGPVTWGELEWCEMRWENGWAY